MDPIHHNNNSNHNYFDLIAVWIGTMFGHFALSDAVLWLTLIYTAVKLYLLLRDELIARKDRNA